MTTVKYLWRGGGEVKVFDFYPEVVKYVSEYGGSYEIIYDTKLSQEEPYCMQSAAHAIDRWKNYKY